MLYLLQSRVKLFWIRVITNLNGKPRWMSLKPRLLRHSASLLTLCFPLENCLGVTWTWMPLKRYQTTTIKWPSAFSQPDHSRFCNRRTNIPPGRAALELRGRAGASQGMCPGAGSNSCCPAQAVPYMIYLTNDTKLLLLITSNDFLWEQLGDEIWEHTRDRAGPCETPALGWVLLGHGGTVSWVSLILINLWVRLSSRSLCATFSTHRNLPQTLGNVSPSQPKAGACCGCSCCSPAPPTQTTSLLLALFISLSSCLS